MNNIMNITKTNSNILIDVNYLIIRGTYCQIRFPNFFFKFEFQEFSNYAVIFRTNLKVILV